MIQTIDEEGGREHGYVLSRLCNRWHRQLTDKEGGITMSRTGSAINDTDNRRRRRQRAWLRLEQALQSMVQIIRQRRRHNNVSDRLCNEW